jgi:sugar phosphate isomerase/epimerase
LNPTDFAISTLCCIDKPLDTALATLAERVNRVEILSDGLHDLIMDSNPCNEYSLTYTVHAPAAEINLAAINERMRAASVNVLADLMPICAAIDAKRVVVHPGFTSYAEVRNRSSSALLRSLDDLVNLQEEHGIPLCVENMGAWECCHFRTPAFLPELTRRGLGFTLDVGHAQINHNLKAFLKIGKFCHIHLHDNCGECDDHLGCGQRSIDFPAIVRYLGPGMTRVVETRELAAADESIAYLRALSRDVIS